MANHKSAIKRHRQSEKRRIRNTSVKTTIKTVVKKVRQSVSAGNAEEAQTGLKTAVRLLDRSVTQGVFHRNSASRRIARLTVKVNSLESK
ncbi:MAG: 30S ribosomal protein S20 [Thermodesulfobacteriota bacterium]|nr:MAG: 30S ribosomal protein S20 [Thermodesulfobacteriota bacterium]